MNHDEHDGLPRRGRSAKVDRPARTAGRVAPRPDLGEGGNTIFSVVAVVVET